MHALKLMTIYALVSAAIVVDAHVLAQDAIAPQAAPVTRQSSDPAPKDDDQKKAAVTPTTSAPPSVTVIDSGHARAILGRDVRSPTDENMGRIADIIVDRGGQVRAAVIDFGGFLGVGSRKIVVDWSALRFSNVANKGESTTLELTRDQVKAAPEYKEDLPIIVLGASGKLEPMRFRLLSPNE